MKRQMQEVQTTNKKNTVIDILSEDSEDSILKNE
jgi:hypothetical protein